MSTESHLLLVPLSYLLLQVMALRQMQSGWHLAAVLPAVLMAVALGLFILGMTLNIGLASLGLVLGLPAATVYLLILLPLHWLLGRG